ncbi:MAG: L-alanine exporter AlaE [bacterium]
MNTKTIKQNVVDAISSVVFGIAVMTPIELWVLDLRIEAVIAIRASSIPGNIIYGIVYGAIANLLGEWRLRHKFLVDTFLFTTLGMMLYVILLTIGKASHEQMTKGIIISGVVASCSGGLYGQWQDFLRKAFNVQKGP